MVNIRDDVEIKNNIDISAHNETAGLSLSSVKVTSLANELNKLHNVVDGITSANSALVVGSLRDLDYLSIIDFNMGGAYVFPNSDGLLGQVLTTNGAGILSFEDVMTSVSNSIIIVESISDFPTPISDVITLEASKTYLISGCVDIDSNRIEYSNNTCICGLNKSLDKLSSTTISNAMFTAIGIEFYLDNITIESKGPSSSILDVCLSNTDRCEIQECIFLNSHSLGNIKGGCLIRFEGNTRDGCSNGIIINGDSITNLHISEYIVKNSTGTDIRISNGTFGSINIINSIFDVPSGSNGLDFSNEVVVNGGAIVMDNIFYGDGTFLVTGAGQSDQKTLRWEYTSNFGIEDTKVFGFMHLFKNGDLTDFNFIRDLSTSKEVEFPLPMVSDSNGWVGGDNLTRFVFSNSINTIHPFPSGAAFNSGKLTYTGVDTVTLRATLHGTTSIGAGTNARWLMELGQGGDDRSIISFANNGASTTLVGCAGDHDFSLEQNVYIRNTTNYNEPFKVDTIPNSTTFTIIKDFAGDDATGEVVGIIDTSISLLRLDTNEFRTFYVEEVVTLKQNDFIEPFIEKGDTIGSGASARQMTPDYVKLTII